MVYAIMFAIMTSIISSAFIVAEMPVAYTICNYICCGFMTIASFRYYKLVSRIERLEKQIKERKYTE